ANGPPLTGNAPPSNATTAMPSGADAASAVAPAKTWGKLSVDTRARDPELRDRPKIDGDGRTTTATRAKAEATRAPRECTGAPCDATAAKHDATAAKSDATAAQSDATAAKSDATGAKHDATATKH